MDNSIKKFYVVSLKESNGFKPLCYFKSLENAMNYIQNFISLMNINKNLIDEDSFMIEEKKFND